MKIYILDITKLPNNDNFGNLQTDLPLNKLQHIFSEKLKEYAIHSAVPNARLNFFHGKHGKPYLLGGEVYFNISHSGKYVVCAISKFECGVDIECIRPYKEALARRICSKNEYKLISESDNKNIKFLEIWTLKEAYLKNMGCGITTLLSAVDTTTKKNCKTLLKDEYVLSSYSDNDNEVEYIHL